MSKDETKVEPQPKAKALVVKDKTQMLQMASIRDAKKWYNDLVKVTKELMTVDLDYGTIPGVSKPSLLKPGAEKLRMLYGLTVDNVCIARIEKTEPDQEPYPYFDYTYRATVKTRAGDIITSVEGSTNSKEPKYAFTWMGEESVPSHLDKDTLKSRVSAKTEYKFAIDKAETGGKYGKPKEYWDSWNEAIKSGEAKRIKKKTSKGKEMVAYQMGGKQYRVPVDANEVYGLKNTLMKMAQKRAFVGAVMAATGASEFFTQDVEDMSFLTINGEVVGESEAKPAAKTVKPLASDFDRRKIFGLANEAGFESEAFKERVKKAQKIDSFTDLTAEQAGWVIAKLEEMVMEKKTQAEAEARAGAAAAEAEAKDKEGSGGEEINPDDMPF